MIRILFINLILDELESIKVLRKEIETFNSSNSKFLLEVLPVMDDLSTDEVRSYVKDHFKNYLEVSQTKGPVPLYLKGYEEALKHNADYIGEIDAGGSHDINDFFKVLESLHPGDPGYVSTRFSKGGLYTNAPLSRKLTSYCGTLLGNLIHRTSFTDLTGGFKVLRKDLAMKATLQEFPQGGAWNILFKIAVKDEGIKEFPITYVGSSSSFKWKWIWIGIKTLIFYRFG